MAVHGVGASDMAGEEGDLPLGGGKEEEEDAARHHTLESKPDAKRPAHTRRSSSRRSDGGGMGIGSIAPALSASAVNLQVPGAQTGGGGGGDGSGRVRSNKSGPGESVITPVVPGTVGTGRM